MADTETTRVIDSLKCDVSVQDTLLNYANKVVETEKKKVAVVAHDSKIVLNSLLEDIQEVRGVVMIRLVGWLVGWSLWYSSCSLRHTIHMYIHVQTKRHGAREEAWLRFLVSKYEVAQHGMERDKMHDNIKYNAAVDSLSQQKELIGQLMRYMAADRQVSRSIAGQNAVLLKELHRMMDVARSTSGRLSKARHMVDGLKKELGMKDDMLQKVGVTDDELEAFKIAMEMEKKGKEFYEKALLEVKTGKEEELFERLIREEQQHYDIFANTYSFLSDTGNWFMWEEHSIVEG